MNIHFSRYSNQFLPTISFAQEKISPYLNRQCKKIMIIVSLALSFITICYTVNYYLKTKKLLALNKQKTISPFTPLSKLANSPIHTEGNKSEKNEGEKVEEIRREKRLKGLENPSIVTLPLEKTPKIEKIARDKTEEMADQEKIKELSKIKKTQEEEVEEIEEVQEVEKTDEIEEIEEVQEVEKTDEIEEIEEVEEIGEDEEGQEVQVGRNTSSEISSKILINLPPDLLLSIFKMLNIQERMRFIRTNRRFYQVHPVVIAPLVEKELVPRDKILELAYKSTRYLTRLNLNPIIANNHPDKNPITDLVVQNLFKTCPNLHALDASSVPYVDSTLTDEFLENPPLGLTSLDVSWCRNLTNAALNHLVVCQELRSLTLRGCTLLTNVIMSQIPTSVYSLDVSFCQGLTEGMLTQLSPKNLLSLNASHCNLRDITLKDQLNLQTLDLSSCKMTVIGGDELDLPVLTSLNLSDCLDLEKLVLQHSTPNLLSLNLQRCPRLSKTIFANLNSKLTSLNLSGCDQLIKQLTDEDLQLPNSLLSLDLSHCPTLTNKLLQCFLTSRLEVLNVVGCHQLTDEFLQYFPSTLTTIYVFGCNRLTESALEKLSKNVTVINS